MGYKIKPKKISFHIEVETDDNGDFELFGSPSYLCPGCRRTKEGAKTCFTEQLIMMLEEYGVGDDTKMTKDAIALRKRIRDCVKIENR